MKLSWEQLKNGMSCCLYCGSFMVTGSGLCPMCLQSLSGRESQDPFLIKPFVCRAQYEWSPGESDLLSRLVLSLKGPRQHQSWEYFAETFARRRLRDLDGRRVHIVPAPPRKLGQVDHAHLWAKALARALGAEFTPCLKRVTGNHQRSGDRGERALAELEIIENSTGSLGLLENTTWIFADDVLTTGSTARAAHKALGSPTHFQAWVLARRSLSCGASKDLL